MKLGSLFDGSGGFPLAGSLCGIEPVWAAEVEPYPIAVTRSRFPRMKHLGDISKVNGAEIEPVDIITFGSPCQDLSVAGKRAGLKHTAVGDDETTRSGLFMEAVRIIKEMREATGGEYPRFALWENVPGAFSSQKGEDFRVVLEELIRIIEPGAVMPAVPKGGWAYADCYCGDGWSLAYRVFDAQYWGVPQRRRRIHLVLDLRGERAGKILFEREGLRGYFTEGRTPWQAAAGDASGGSGADDRAGEGFNGYNGDLTGAVSATLGVNCGVSTGRNGVIERIGGLDALGLTNRGFYSGDKAETLRAESHGAIPMVVTVPYTLKIRSGCEGGGSSVTSICVKDCLPFDTTQVTSPQNGCNPKWGDPCHPLAAQGHPPTVICKCYESHPMDSRIKELEDDISPTVSVKWHKGAADTPLVCVKCYDARGNGDGQTVNTLTGDHENRITDYTSVVCEPIPIHDKATRYKGGGPTRNGDGAGNGLGVGKSGDPCPTLSTCDHHMVCYCEPGVAYCTDIGFFNSIKEVSLTLLARSYKDPHLVSYPENEVCYIVRRLTPTECARLQGFPDCWGDISKRDSFTSEEYEFWLDVRNTHATINGKKAQDYTEAQMLTWYNKLHTDSAEYKMWGNGIALPPALYCMQGIADSLTAEDDDWMN